VAAIITYIFGAACLTKWLHSLVSKEREHECVTGPKESKSLVGRVRHDLRNSLNVVMGFADLLSTGNAGPLNEKQQLYVHNIRVGTRQMLGLLSSKTDGAESTKSSDLSESFDETARI